MGASRFVSMGWALLAALCLAVVPAAAGENPMVGDSIRKILTGMMMPARNNTGILATKEPKEK